MQKLWYKKQNHQFSIWYPPILPNPSSPNPVSTNLISPNIQDLVENMFVSKNGNCFSRLFRERANGR
jgi:hypothetical protein